MPKYALLLLAVTGLGNAQQGSVAGPVAGFVFDSGAQALRPLRGMAGAATIGDPVASAYQFTAAFVAPRQDSAFGVAAPGAANAAATHYFTLNSSTLTEVAIDGLMAQPERIVYSPSGTAAVLYSNGQAQLVSGLPGSPSLAGSIQLREGARSLRPTAFAVSDDGAYLLFALGGSIQLASQSGGVRGVLTAGSGASVAFAPGAHDAAIASSAAGAVLVKDVAGAAAQQTLTAADDSFQTVAGLGFSTDGKRVFVASAAAQSVIALDLAGNRTDIACNCAPTEFTPMGSLFRLNELGSGPLWLADMGSSGPRVVFVPALTAAQ
jgi:hypothetical protein